MLVEVITGEKAPHVAEGSGGRPRLRIDVAFVAGGDKLQAGEGGKLDGTIPAPVGRVPDRNVITDAKGVDFAAEFGLVGLGDVEERKGRDQAAAPGGCLYSDFL